MNSISIGESQLAPIEILFIHKMQIKSNCPVKTWQRKYLQPSVPSQTKLMKKYRMSTPILQSSGSRRSLIAIKRYQIKRKVNWMIGESDTAILEASGPVHPRETRMTTTYRDEIPF